MKKLKLKKLSKKKKILIIVLASLLLISLSLIIVVFVNNNRDEDGEYITNNNECIVVKELVLKVGDKLPNDSSFIQKCNKKGAITYYLNNQKVNLKELKDALEYKVVIEIEGKKYTSKLVVKKDSTITFEVKDLEIDEGKSYKADDFVKECKDDHSKKCTYSFEKEEMGKYTQSGSYNIIIVAKVSGETIKKEAKLTIKKKEETASEVTKVDTVSETTTTSSNYKYGVTEDVTTTVYYDVYSDGSKREVNRSNATSYNYHNFNATTNELQQEASTLVSSNYNTLSSVVSYVNEYRKEVNVPSITMDSSLNLAASVRALEIAWSQNFSHTRPNGSTCFTVLDDLGIGYMSAGENIAYGYYDAASVSNGWKNSPGHYQNMIDASYTKIGVGTASAGGNIYWVQIFTS